MSLSKSDKRKLRKLKKWHQSQSENPMPLTRPEPKSPSYSTDVSRVGYATSQTGTKWEVEGQKERRDREEVNVNNFSESVIILAADTAYLSHAKSLLVGCRTCGDWRGDFVLIVPSGTDAEDFDRRGVNILHAETDDCFYQKFHIFAPSFRKWKRALYMDCDVLVQDTIQPLFAELDEHPLVADVEPFSLFHTFTYWSNAATYDNAPDEIYDWLWTNYDPRYRQYNTAFLLFRPSSIPTDAIDRLRCMRQKIAPINTHVIRGTDQPVINLTFYRQFIQIPKKMFSYWEHEGPESRLLHYCSGYAPWIDKKSGMDAFGNPRLNSPCYDVYTQNLSRWEEVFPVCR